MVDYATSTRHLRKRSVTSMIGEPVSPFGEFHGSEQVPRPDDYFTNANRAGIDAGPIRQERQPSVAFSQMSNASTVVVIDDGERGKRSKSAGSLAKLGVQDDEDENGDDAEDETAFLWHEKYTSVDIPGEKGSHGVPRRKRGKDGHWKPLPPVPKWKQVPKKRFIWQGIALGAAAAAGWLLGRRGAFSSPGHGGIWSLSKEVTVVEKDSTCDPYEQHGVLLVNTSVPSENRWDPISAPESCQPVDYMTLLLQSSHGEPSPTLDFARNRTIMIFGDSVDRDHNDHFCKFVKGIYEMIPDNHPLSPPYPEGQKIPPPDYKNHWTGERIWPNYDQSRPYICHVESLNFRLVNVFHYGFRPETNFIVNHPHYYPPATIEDRFDQIVVPLLRNIAIKYGTSSVPDIFSFAPGFWGIMRLSVEAEKEVEDLVRSGVPFDVAKEEKNVWNNMKPKQREWLYSRMVKSLRHIAKGWREAGHAPGVLRSPEILWRTLHHIKEHRLIPYSRLNTVDQIGRQVVRDLTTEGKAANEGPVGWDKWRNKVKAYLGVEELVPEEIQREVVVEDDLADRLRLDTWGDKMLGQEHHFRDAIHPLPLPGSYLWGNMIMQQLKTAVEERNVHSA